MNTDDPFQVASQERNTVEEAFIIKKTRQGSLLLVYQSVANNASGAAPHPTEVATLAKSSI